MHFFKPHLTEKSVFTRMCISEAIISLMEHTEFDKLRISQIVKRAGVSRMTFYKYYASPYEALTDYLKLLIGEYIKLNKIEEQTHKFFEYEHILFSLNFFDQYSKYFLILEQNNLHSILLDGINEYMSERVHSHNPLNYYKAMAYSGGLLNVFISWEASGKQVSAEDLAAAIHDFYNLRPGM